MINAPILHVNGDYPEDVARAVEIAFKYRNYFRKVSSPLEYELDRFLTNSPGHRC